jgi:hypothetical protein
MRNYTIEQKQRKKMEMDRPWTTTGFVLVALVWQPAGKCKVGWPKRTWRRTVETNCG